ncbi:YigZ family protein [Myroides odoratus]|uniref:IMPACT family member yigZ n=1 Tax=Myroides odoratus TaxID=256 RepID=A0A378RMH2_MYROD|nr:YigZ family protein [Myroides odoratus]MCS4240319.1 putative YigZ family protein [Myroides odoratus]MDH6600311.1 putative YigZ family protein [Myroides gitamensis]QQU05044.1 YigZ family protein [Myroides odoratus]STZ27481.1 IMPACT family member yigZ [Myroides odoratus]
MTEEKDFYKTISQPTEEVLYKEKNSKFFGYAFPIKKEEQVKEILDQIKKVHYNARHWCYAFQLGTDPVYYRANDDGEPSNTAGAPIYGQIQSFDLTDILIVVVRYFGGVKLGVGGLITAYRAAAQMALEEADIIECTIDKKFKVRFDYKDMNNVMRVIKERNLQLVQQKLEMTCEIELSIRKSEYQQALDAFVPYYEVKVIEPSAEDY